MSDYTTIREIQAANKAAGLFFFEPDTMKFFNSKIEPGIISGRYFITSERFDQDSARLYTVREVDADGHITSASEFQQFSTRDDAREFARGLVK